MTKTTKQTTLTSFDNFAKHTKTLSGIKQKNNRVTKTTKQTTLASFDNFAKYTKTLSGIKQKNNRVTKTTQSRTQLRKKQTTLPFSPKALEKS